MANKESEITKRFKPRLVANTKTKQTPEFKTPKRRPILKIVITKTVIAFALISGAAPALAKSIINPLTRSYSVIESDEFNEMKLKRTYSTRSVFRGHFGTGWCSEIDGRVSAYDGGEIRYRGCDIVSADLIDARLTAKSVRRTARGFERIREDGATQFFNSSGYLEKVLRTDGEIRIVRDSEMYPVEIVTRNPKVEARFRIELMSRQSEPCFALILSMGSQSSFEFKDGILTAHLENRKTVSSYSYDDQMNMRIRVVNGESETIDYDDIADQVVRIERSSAFGRERLLFAIARNEKSGMIEMKIEVERGAATHPVRILYDVVTHRLSVEGDRSVARILLNWIRT